MHDVNLIKILLGILISVLLYILGTTKNDQWANFVVSRNNFIS